MIIRVQTASGQKRIKLDNGSTFGDLTKAIEKEFGIQPANQILSFTPLHNPDIIQSSLSASLSELSLKHGSQVWLDLDADTRKKLNQIPVQKFRQCQTVTLSTVKWEPEPKPPKHIPFNFWISEKQREYKGKPWNFADLSSWDYRAVKYGKTNQVKIKELPSNAVLHRQQEYRHCDNLVFEDPDMINRFRTNWLKNSKNQRACILFGNFKEREVKHKYHGDNVKYMATEAHVYGLYEPLQKGEEHGVVFTKSVKKILKKKIKMYQAMGMEPVGWMITTRKREDKAGEIFLSGDEIIQACKFQHVLRQGINNVSKFVTVILHEDGTKEPNGYMISDQGVAMVRDGLVTQSAELGRLKVKKIEEGFYQPAVVMEGKDIKPGESFAPDVMLVQVVVTRSKEYKKKFKFVDIYEYCSKNSMFPSRPDEKIIRIMLRNSQRSKLPYHERCSDFLLLLHLNEFIDENLAMKLAKAVTDNRSLNNNEKLDFDAAFSAFNF